MNFYQLSSQHQCNSNPFGFHFCTLLVKSFVRSYLSPTFHPIFQPVTPDCVCTLPWFYLLLRPQQVYFTLCCSELQTCSFHHFSSVICNSLRCLRASWDSGDHFPFFQLDWEIVCWSRRLCDTQHNLLRSQWPECPFAAHRRVRVTSESFWDSGLDGSMDPTAIISLHSHIHTLKNIGPQGQRGVLAFVYFVLVYFVN